METKLTEATLRNGRRVEVLCIQTPAPEWRDRIAPFLAHKGQPWNWHIESHLEGKIDQLEQRFFIAVAGEDIISEMMVVEKYGLAILAHVFTTPAWRKQGASSVLMKAMADDFAARDGTAMHLKTDFESQAYRIYRRYGFESILPGSGLMKWIRHPDRFEAFFDPRAADTVRIERVCWTHWPLIHKLMLRPEGDWLRNAAFGLAGVCNGEDPFVMLMARLKAGPPYDAAVLVNAAGMTVGLATLQPYQALPSRMMQLDAYVHPTAYGHLDELIGAITLPDDRPVMAQIDSESTRRRQALLDAGFREAGRIRDALCAEGNDLDLVVMQI